MRRFIGTALAIAGAAVAVFPAVAVAGPSNSAIVVANAGANSILEFAPGATGNATPADVIAGAQTGLDGPFFVVFDPDGDVVVANGNNSSVTEYVPGANGNVAPFATIAGSNTGINNPSALGFDGNGNLYVFNEGTSAGGESVTEYAPGANGNVAPIAKISGSATGLSGAAGSGAMVVRPSGAVLVAAGSANSVLGFAPGANGNVAPVTDIQGSNTELNTVTGVALDPSGNIYASNSGPANGPSSIGSITEYAANATGNVAPIERITGTATGLDDPADLAVDASTGDVIAVNLNNSSVTEYSPGSNGNVAAVATISGSSTGLNGPQGVSSGSPILVTEAPAPQSVLVGDNAQFTASAAGTPTPTVQWQVSTGGGGYTDVPGATSTTLSISAVTSAQDGSLYRAVFTSSVGTATTAPAQLTVIGFATVQPEVPAPSGATYTFGSVPDSSFACTAGAHATLSSCTGTIDGGPSFTSGAPLDGTVGTHTLTITATESPSAVTSTSITYTVEQATPILTWANPSPITYGTPLSGTQLDATASGAGGTSLAGTFTYSPPAGTVLRVGTSQVLTVTFTPADTTDYTNASTSASITVNPASLSVDASPASETYGGSASLTYTLSGFVNGENATTAHVTGSASCSIDPSASPDVGTDHNAISCAPGSLAAPNYTFTQGSAADLTITPASLSVDANPASKTFGGPAPTLTYALDGFVNGENATTAHVTGSANCSIAPGTGTSAGTYPGAIICTPGSLAAPNYTFSTGKAADLTITQAAPTINWPTPAPITYGTPLSSTQLDATASGVGGSSLAGTFTYAPPAGTVLPVGANQTLSVTFQPNDSTDYTSATATVRITVNKAGTKLVALSLIEVLPSLAVGRISATLERSDNGQPISGETIAFTAGGSTLCTATTGTAGGASCSFSLTNLIRGVLSLGYTATFAGDGSYTGSTAHGSLIKIAFISLARDARRSKSHARRQHKHHRTLHARHGSNTRHLSRRG